MYMFAVDDGIGKAIEKHAKARGLSVEEMFRKFIKLGLVAIMLEETEGCALIVREPGKLDREMTLT